MGLLDVLNGMQNGPRGSSAPDKGGMSPITMAILAMLAYKAVGKLTSTQAAPAPAPNPGAGTAASGDLGGLANVLTGGLGKLLQGGASGPLAGAVTGGALSGGLSDLLKQFQNTGQGDVAKTWVGTGPNRAISQDDVARAIGDDNIDALARHAGVSRDELLAGLSQHLPNAVNELTPDGRVPTADEMSRMMGGGGGQGARA